MILRFSVPFSFVNCLVILDFCSWYDSLIGLVLMCLKNLKVSAPFSFVKCFVFWTFSSWFASLSILAFIFLKIWRVCASLSFVNCFVFWDFFFWFASLSRFTWVVIFLVIRKGIAPVSCVNWSVNWVDFSKLASFIFILSNQIGRCAYLFKTRLKPSLLPREWTWKNSRLQTQNWQKT